MLAAALLAISAFSVSAPPTPQARAAPRQNIVLILTDDQRPNTLQYMPNVTSELVANGVKFTHSFDNNPLCCPARATILTGQTSGDNGVWFNTDSPIGGFQAFKPHGGQTVVKWLHDAGYHTGFIGKFMNGYKYSTGNYKWILPGTDEWDAFLLDGTAQTKTGCSPKGYYATCYSHNGTLETHGPSDYSTTTSGAKAVDFIDSTPANQPLFLYYAPRAPHLPIIPENKYVNACPTLPLLRPPSYGELIQHGPAFMESLKKISAKVAASYDLEWKNSCRTLLSVDDQVKNIVQALQDTNRLDNTLILYASDNGFLFGEHRWKGKIVPYDEASNVPVVIRDDAYGTAGTVDDHLITNMDYTATFLDAAGVSAPAGYRMDGQSMLPLIGGSGTWNNENAVLIEHSGGDKVPPYCGVRVSGWLYTRYATGEEELYDMTSDPYQLTNVAGQPGNAGILDDLRAQTKALCHPLPPGFTWGT